MTQFFFRTLNLFLIIGVLFYYQSIVILRAEERNLYEVQVQKAEELAAEYELQVAQADAEVAFQKYLGEIKYGNGIFEGIGKGFGGEIQIQMTVENYQISRVEIVAAPDEDAAYYEQAAAILPAMIIEKQSAKVDTVSGATSSSKGIIEAAEKALECAQKAKPTEEVIRAQWQEMEK